MPLPCNTPQKGERQCANVTLSHSGWQPSNKFLFRLQNSMVRGDLVASGGCRVRRTRSWKTRVLKGPSPRSLSETLLLGLGSTVVKEGEKDKKKQASSAGPGLSDKPSSSDKLSSSWAWEHPRARQRFLSPSNQSTKPPCSRRQAG
jgi:hypothetical protein